MLGLVSGQTGNHLWASKPPQYVVDSEAKSAFYHRHDGINASHYVVVLCRRHNSLQLWLNE